MLINWINVSIYAEQWTKLGILLPQAERAISELIERESVPTSAAGNYGVGLFQQKNPPLKSYKEIIETCKAKISAVSGLSKMHEKNFKQAAEKFMTVCLFKIT